ncbi:hypothetical protein ACFSFZ_12910 [Mixta tenebrionis]|uniref:Sel1 repeat family protein n=1 Tax=Mixta tenebrionis TaxID=2562439 RepID=A0A506VEK4_9GAMM|nr:hypothetical protein [Mixta tenebrionis]TPW44491.1 hypothetical protein FKM52_01920 [Mixta tenebrionis]
MMKLNYRFPLLFCICGLLFSASAPARANSGLPAVETVLQKGFPARQHDLEKLTTALFDEYSRQKNVASLVFYAYGALQLAHHYDRVNDIVKAAEYAKLGFFYLDEAVDLHESDTRVRYLRARLDAWLPAKLGRCAIVLHDTAELLAANKAALNELTPGISYMRYRALYHCGEQQQAAALLAQITARYPDLPWLALENNVAPQWEAREVAQIILPLVNGG